MDDVVPGALQRLRAADIVRMAGLTAASLGQEYCRTGAVHSTQREGMRLSGVVAVSQQSAIASRNTVANAGASHTEDESAPSLNDEVSKETSAQHAAERHHYLVEVEIQSSTRWSSTCSCNTAAPSLCQHAAALLYYWLSHPFAFAASSTSAHSNDAEVVSQPRQQNSSISPIKPAPLTKQTGRGVSMRGPSPLGSVTDMLAQLGLTELRTMAREYELSTSGLNKQQLAEALLHALRQPDIVRRVAATLEKPQRQLLATLILLGGTITDDDLRGLFERFAFGTPDKLQDSLVALSNKCLLFRTSLNSSPQQRIGLSGSLLDIGWFVPLEVRSTLRATMPVLAFDVEKALESKDEPPRMLQVKPNSFPADLLFVARTLDGYSMEPEGVALERGENARSPAVPAPMRSSGAFLAERTSSSAVAAPEDIPLAALLRHVESLTPLTPAFLRFAVRLLRLANILYKDDVGTPHLRALPNAAQLLLGPAATEVARDLFDLWLTQQSYEELYDLQEEGLKLRSRTTTLNHSVLRAGELEMENSEARQALVALIAQVPHNQWIHFSAFARFVYRLYPLFLQRRQRFFPTPHWWLEQEEGRPLQPLQLNDWMRAEGRYLARLIRGPLFWWNICDLAVGDDGRLLAFRLTTEASYFLHGAQPPARLTGHTSHDPSSILKVQQQGELLIACTPAAWPLIELVEKFANPCGVCDGRLCYRLAPRSLADAMSRGEQPNALLALLRQIAAGEHETDGALPRLLEQLERRVAGYGRARLYTDVTLLGVADNLVLRELAATTSIEQHIVRAVQPTLLILKKQGAARMIDELKRRGQVPLLHEEEMNGTERP